jgi:hypothetical protein
MRAPLWSVWHPRPGFDTIRLMNAGRFKPGIRAWFTPSNIRGNQLPGGYHLRGAVDRYPAGSMVSSSGRSPNLRQQRRKNLCHQTEIRCGYDLITDPKGRDFPK